MLLMGSLTLTASLITRSAAMAAKATVTVYKSPT
jgi:flavoprotein